VSLQICSTVAVLSVLTVDIPCKVPARNVKPYVFQLCCVARLMPSRNNILVLVALHVW